MATSKIKTEEDFSILRWKPERLGMRVVQDEYVESSRWLEHHRLVWTEDDGETFFAYVYDVPATEQQDGSEDEFDPDEIAEVVPRERVIIEYVDAD